MAPVDNLIQFIIEEMNINKYNRLETLKLQKLLYYCNGWNYALNNKELIFDNALQAWAHGPVVPDIFHQHKNKPSIDEWGKGDSAHLPPSQKNVVRAVISMYGAKTGWALRNQTHKEEPWINHWEAPVNNIFSNSNIPWEEVGEYFKNKN